jgi:hypothetical protein
LVATLDEVFREEWRRVLATLIATQEAFSITRNTTPVLCPRQESNLRHTV